jgi:hypothetical protein
MLNLTRAQRRKKMQKDILDLVELSPTTVDAWAGVIDHVALVLERAGRLPHNDADCSVKAFAQQDGTLLLHAKVANINITLEVPKEHWNWSNRN